MSALEAMSLGVPIVTTSLNSGVSEINVDGETGLVVRSKSVTDLANGINKMLSRKALRKFGENARARYLKNYTLKKMLKSHIELYESL